MEGLARALCGEVSVGGLHARALKNKKVSKSNLEQVTATGFLTGSDKPKRIWAKCESRVATALQLQSRLHRRRHLPPPACALEKREVHTHTPGISFYLFTLVTQHPCGRGNSAISDA